MSHLIMQRIQKLKQKRIRADASQAESNQQLGLLTLSFMSPSWLFLIPSQKVAKNELPALGRSTSKGGTGEIEKTAGGAEGAHHQCLHVQQRQPLEEFVQSCEIYSHTGPSLLIWWKYNFVSAITLSICQITSVCVIRDSIRFCSFLFYTETIDFLLQLIYNVLILGVQENNSFIYIYVCMFQILSLIGQKPLILYRKIEKVLPIYLQIASKAIQSPPLSLTSFFCYGGQGWSLTVAAGIVLVCFYYKLIILEVATPFTIPRIESYWGTHSMNGRMIKNILLTTLMAHYHSLAFSIVNYIYN